MSKSKTAAVVNDNDLVRVIQQGVEKFAKAEQLRGGGGGGGKTVEQHEIDWDHDEFLTAQDITAIGKRLYLTDVALSGYKEVSVTPSPDAETYIEVAGATNNQYIGGWIVPSALMASKLLAGIYNFVFVAEKTTGTRILKIYWTLVERFADTSETLIATSSDSIDITVKGVKQNILALPSDHVFATGSRAVMKVYARVEGGGSAPTVRLYYRGVDQSHFEFPSNTEILSELFVPYSSAVSDVNLNDKKLVNINTLAVGMNSPNISTNFHVATSTLGVGVFERNVENVGGAVLLFDKTRGTYSSKSQVLANDVLGGFSLRGYGNSIMRPGAAIRAYADADFTNTSSPGRIEFDTVPVASTTLTTRMVIKNDGKFGINTTTPASRLQVIGDTRMGAASDYTEVETDGTIKMVGAATVFQDVVFGAHQIEPDKVNFPQYDETYIARAFAHNVDQHCTIIVVPPLGYRHGTDCEVYVDWMPESTNTGDVLWALQFTWTEIGAVQAALSNMSKLDTPSGTAYQHQRCNIGTISGSGKTINSCLSIIITRRGSDGSDNYTGSAMLKNIRFRFELDTIGSRTLTTK